MKIRKGWLVLPLLIVAIILVPFASSGADNQAPAAPTNLRIVPDSPAKVKVAPPSDQAVHQIKATEQVKDIHWFKATLGHISTMKGDNLKARKNMLYERYNKEALASRVMLEKEGLPLTIDGKTDFAKYHDFATQPKVLPASSGPKKVAEQK